MPKRRATLASARASKRIKFDSFGAPDELDGLPPAHVAAHQQSGPSSAGVSVRSPRRVNGVPTLVSYAAQVFAEHFKTLYIPKSENLRIDGYAMRRRLNDLPDTLIPRLLLLLREHCPNYLRSDILTTYFLRGREIRLSADLPGVNTMVVKAIGAYNTGILSALDLTRLPAINDQVFAKVVARLPELERLVLRGCSKAGPLVLEAAASNCPRLRVLNMNYTVATPRSIFSVLLACKELEVLKIAGVPKLVSGCVAVLINSYIEENPDDELPIFTSLRSLKIRLTNLSDSDLATIFPHCPNLTTLDISFTPIKKIPIVDPFPPLKKLSLTSTRISGTNLVHILENSPGLEVLYLGAYGETVGGAPGITNNLTDSLLREVTNALVHCSAIRNVNLAGNPKLGTSGSVRRALQDFFRRVGRRCETLNFENVPQLHSGDLEGLLCISDDDQPSPLRSLNVARTGVNGDAAMFIAACSKLEVLNMAATRFGKEELFMILDCCPDLVKIDLTGCRSISVQDRRRFFEVWESARGDAPLSSQPSEVIYN
ncbi:RNI-like protein [Rhizoctonia solani 123E]|uniref:RNI-like protein n=1 Tax=Rhizoctonia solani 123E TaxID=1423351 RepID=A0A074RWD9_9AGAM|nr:RNI-like protein [Rhizoctonia solani 123E]